jgi:uncharacterized protein YceH (UPF0502 family)
VIGGATSAATTTAPQAMDAGFHQEEDAEIEELRQQLQQCQVTMCWLLPFSLSGGLNCRFKVIIAANTADLAEKTNDMAAAQVEACSCETERCETNSLAMQATIQALKEEIAQLRSSLVTQ